MRRPIVGWVLGVVVVLAVAAVAYLYFAGGTGEPSTELTTPTLAATEDGMVAFVIDPTRSSAAFEIDEVLRGEPQRVVGTTSELAGQFEMNPNDLSSVEFSEIVVNARTFDTGSGNRDRAIRGPVILDSASDEFEFITFNATSVEGLQGSLTEGELLEFTVEGDLVIRDTVNTVTFDVTATPIDEDTIDGSAEATVFRSDYGIGIPNAPGVADVSDEVLIRLEFVATS
jgi:polyisoprenoid-binding protein YceI